MPHIIDYNCLMNTEFVSNSWKKHTNLKEWYIRWCQINLKKHELDAKFCEIYGDIGQMHLGSNTSPKCRSWTNFL